MELLTPGEIRDRYGDLPYITPYRKIIALVDDTGEWVELHEFHARGRCTGGAAWEVFHYGGTSPLVAWARREGARNIFRCRVGSHELELVPGIAGAGIEQVMISGDEVAVTYAGLAGGGVAATLCRGMAEGVIGAEVHEQGGGAKIGRATLRLPALRKLVVGVDDTDDASRGATWSTVNEISFEIERGHGCHYLGHTIVQLYPDNPHKTTNCCATAVVLGATAEALAWAKERMVEELRGRCYSEECGAAFHQGVDVPRQLRCFFEKARSGMVTLNAARDAADLAGAEIEEITGSRGCIGAVAALGAYEDPDAAVIPATGGRRPAAEV